jgi:3-oxoacyl-[acyl-carrier protein] reductase
MSRLAGTVARELGTPDTLVLNASDRDLYGPAADGDFTSFRRHIDAQLTGSHALVSACLDGMIAAGGGVIIGIGSTFAQGAPPPGMAPYVVAKSALAAYIRCLAAEYGRHGVRANLVAPAMTHTALLSGVPDRAQKVAAAQNPMRRLATPEDTAGAVAFIASPEAAYVNGHVLTVSGGGVMA